MYEFVALFRVRWYWNCVFFAGHSRLANQSSKATHSTVDIAWVLSCSFLLCLVISTKMLGSHEPNSRAQCFVRIQRALSSSFMMMMILDVVRRKCRRHELPGNSTWDLSVIAWRWYNLFKRTVVQLVGILGHNAESKCHGVLVFTFGLLFCIFIAWIYTF